MDRGSFAPYYRFLRAFFGAMLFVALIVVSPGHFSVPWLMVWGSAAGLIAAAVLGDGPHDG